MSKAFIIGNGYVPDALIDRLRASGCDSIVWEKDLANTRDAVSELVMSELVVNTQSSKKNESVFLLNVANECGIRVETAGCYDPDAIVGCVARLYGISAEKLTEEGRYKSNLIAREMAAYVMWHFCIGPDEISRAINRDRATIYYYIKAMRGIISVDKTVRKRYEETLEMVASETEKQ